MQHEPAESTEAPHSVPAGVRVGVPALHVPKHLHVRRHHRGAVQRDSGRQVRQEDDCGRGVPRLRRPGPRLLLDPQPLGAPPRALPHGRRPPHPSEDGIHPGYGGRGA
ncbi:uncharacterized protein LOC122260448 [Penaeus japonicus]|uniref:uncharacterized protein LOC122260448 n=1 Tax=Penaeus japonicus TaxID=27405 RepID=UPI001C70FFFF|nr:uncharacterized protein LOC122260448 [Penaeus japonicus]